MYLSLQVCGFSHGFRAVQRLSVLFYFRHTRRVLQSVSLDPACICVCVYFFIEATLFDMFQLCVDLWLCVYTSVCVCGCVCVAEQCFSAACSMKSLELLTALLLPFKHENNSLCERRVTVGPTPREPRRVCSVCVCV